MVHLAFKISFTMPIVKIMIEINTLMCFPLIIKCRMTILQALQGSHSFHFNTKVKLLIGSFCTLQTIEQAIM